MVSGIWGRKIGMTQVFVGDKVVPVTAINVGNWLVTAFKLQDKDGYNAIQVGCLRKRYSPAQFDVSWLKNRKRYFTLVREIPVSELPDGIEIGKSSPLIQQFGVGDLVNVTGQTKGRGFAGVVRRHDFAGGRASHGSKMGKRTGSLSHLRSQGRVIKGKLMPGHMGTVTRTMRNLALVQLLPEQETVLVKGCVPGHSGSFVFITKQSK